MIYQIDYDLRKPGRNYDDLYAAIKALGSWAHPLKSTWVVDTQYNATQIRDHLLGQMDKNDGLLVTRLSGESAWHGLAEDVERWLRDHLGRPAPKF